jgi:transcriptional regulator with XRE-family HTH domain
VVSPPDCARRAEWRPHSRDVAHTLGVSKSAVTSWKEGTRPNPEQVKAAAAAYGVDPLELLHIAYLSDGNPKAAPKKRRPKLAPDFVAPPENPDV